MLEFLKRCGLGVLYIVAAPFAIVLLVLFAIIGLFVFLVMLVKSIILFFTGRSVFDDLPEDIEAKRRLGTLIDTRIKKAKSEDQKETTVEESHIETSEKEAKKEEEPEKVSDSEKEAPTTGGDA